MEPVLTDDQTNDYQISYLVRQGLATAPRHRLDVESFLSGEIIRLPKGVSAIETLLKERREAR
ncbi:MAG: hypothetical protein DRP87_15995 [Spirochaetes bacterium]|nr:MAG: hypothetical protein DRP87_15995 [Spirochaetota bacterium]